MRDFIKKSYASIKNENPGFPFLIREADGVKAKMTARYGMSSDIHRLMYWLLDECVPRFVLGPRELSVQMHALAKLQLQCLTPAWRHLVRSRGPQCSILKEHSANSNNKVAPAHSVSVVGRQGSACCPIRNRSLACPADYGAECGVAIEGMDPSNIEQSLKELIRKGTTMNQKTT